jgi:photosystem I subunit 8
MVPQSSRHHSFPQGKYVPSEVLLFSKFFETRLDKFQIVLGSALPCSSFSKATTTVNQQKDTAQFTVRVNLTQVLIPFNGPCIRAPRQWLRRAPQRPREHAIKLKSPRNRPEKIFQMLNLYLPSILVPLVGLVFPGVAMAALFLYIEKEELS